MCSILSLFFGLYLVWFHAFLFLFIKENVQLHYYIHIFYFVPLEKDLKTFCVATVKYFFVWELGQVSVL